MAQEEICNHIKDLTTLQVADEPVCEICIQNHGRWVHLRTCQTCSITLCCDDSPMKHMTAHYHETGHPVVSSAEPGERWLWCYKDEVFAEY